MTTPNEFIPDYTLNRNTYLLKSIRNGHKVHTVVKERHGIFYVAKKSLKLIDTACKDMGSSYRTAAERTKNLIPGNKHKLPVVVGVDKDHHPYIMFPLFSPKSEHNIWVAFNAITHITDNKTSVTVTFWDEVEVDLPITMSSFNNQYVTSAMLFKAIYKHWHRF